MPLTLSQIRTQMKKELIPLYGEAETLQMIRMLFEQYCGISGAKLILKQNEYLPVDQYNLMMEANSALKNNIPVQYIIGSAWFADLRFEVNPSVLIPRPETEEMVNLILTDANRLLKNDDFRLIDIGSGSGCIAVALKKSLPGWKVEACDISAEALQVAQRNATQAGADVHFFKADILRWNEWAESGLYDIIVSNPPYICEQEKSQMKPNVLQHEPSLALFVPDDDPLLFYRSIAEFASLRLKKNGKLYLEINESFGPEIIDLLNMQGFKDIGVRKDIREKNRFALARKV